MIGFFTVQLAIRVSVHLLITRPAAAASAAARARSSTAPVAVPTGCDTPSGGGGGTAARSSDGAALPLSEEDPNIEWLSGMLGGLTDSGKKLTISGSGGKKRSSLVVGGTDIAQYASALNTLLHVTAVIKEIMDDLFLLLAVFILSVASASKAVSTGLLQ